MSSSVPRAAVRPPGVPRTIALTGHMGAGKTSVGRALAKKLGRPFVDLDEAIVGRAGTSVANIFAERGEAEFRRYEQETLTHVLTTGGDQVIALGGGTLESEANRKALAAPTAVLVHLTAPVEELWRRCTEGRREEEIAKRPLLSRGHSAFAARYHERANTYASADIEFSTEGKSVNEVVSQLAATLAAI